ncbi:uncharacterized protein LOC135374647 isoform X1 [Ornithodoros turicata]|uniref:uncharacterized protein LOC135374647 isoform X1 n=1 Tax=Ornithodoros turicata TaxID=34597 RepID=UPI0031388393
MARLHSRTSFALYSHSLFLTEPYYSPRTAIPDENREEQITSGLMTHVSSKYEELSQGLTKYGYGTRFLWYCQYDCTKNGKVEKRNEPDREQCAVIPADRNTEMKDIKTGECKSGHCHVFPWPYKGHSQKEGVNYPRQVETLLPAPCVDEYGNFQVASSCESQFPDQLRAIGLVEQGEQHRTTSSDTDQGEQQGLEDVAHSVRAHSCRYWELETVSFRRFHSHDALCEKSNFMFSCQSCGATFQSQLQWLQAIGNFVIPTCCTSGNRSKERVLHTDC